MAVQRVPANHVVDRCYSQSHSLWKARPNTLLFCKLIGRVNRYLLEYFDIMCCSSSFLHRRSKLAQQYANSKQVVHPCTSLLPIFRVISRRALLRAQLLRQSAQSSPIPPSHFTALTDHLTHAFTKGDYLKIDPSKPIERDADGNRIAPPAMSSLTDPAMMEGMMGGMKSQFATMVPQMLIMGWVNFFFSGFVLSAYSLLFLDPRTHI